MGLGPDARGHGTADEAAGSSGLGSCPSRDESACGTAEAVGSTLEYEALEALAERGVVLVRQQAVELRNGHRIHLDGADPTIRWGVEIGHVPWHGGRTLAQADTQRRRSARLVGWEIEQVTDQECREERSGTLDDLVELYPTHGGRLAA